MIAMPRKAWNGSVMKISSIRTVRQAVRHRVEPEQRPEPQAAHHQEVHVVELVQPRVAQRRLVPAGK